MSRAICWTSVSSHKHFMCGYFRKGFSGHRVPLGDRGGVTTAPNFYFVVFFSLLFCLLLCWRRGLSLCMLSQQWTACITVS